MQNAFTTLICLGITAIGCDTLHTDNDASMPVAYWSRDVFVERDGRKVPAEAELIVDTLKKAGIHATADDAGLHIAPEDEERAQEALLVDERLKGSGILVVVPVLAGTGRRTPEGVQFTMPTTQPVE